MVHRLPSGRSRPQAAGGTTARNVDLKAVLDRINQIIK